MQKTWVSFKGLVFIFSVFTLWGFPSGLVEAMLAPIPVGPGYQCPNDIDNSPFDWSSGGAMGAEDKDHNGNGIYDTDSNVVCVRLGASDGYNQMPDGSNHYGFGFMDLTGVPEADIIDYRFKADLPAPLIEAKEGQLLYITVTNLGFALRLDLDDPHTLHFHGFRHAMAIFDGVPELSIAVPAGRDFTYFYKLNDPGTYPYHCHVEPTEHIQFGMTGIILVHPLENTPTQKYAYDDGLAPSTQYDVAYDLFINEVDPIMHYNMEQIQEGANLWHEYDPSYFTFNGRAYPDTLLPDDDTAMININGYVGNNSSLITATAGDRILLRLVSLGYQAHTLTVPGIPMHVVGEDARILRGPNGKDLSYWKTTYSIAGGKTADIILDTTGLSPGETYFLFARELNEQSNLLREDREIGIGAENRGGMMTEIRIN